MAARRWRPRFELRLPEEPDAVVQRIRACLLAPDAGVRGMISEPHRVLELRLPPEERHLWSPALGLTVEAADEGEGAVVHGLLGPMPGVWTGLAFATIALGTGLLFLLTFGAVQLGLGKDPWALYLAALHVVLLVVVRVVAGMGRKLAAPQSAVLRRFLEEALGVSTEPPTGAAADPYRP